MEPLALLVIVLFLYLLPTFIAGCRGHHNTLAIGALNILFGWTLLGWAVAFIWSFTAPRHLLCKE